MTETWPDHFPKPLLNNSDKRVIPNVVRTKMTGGRIRIRRRSTVANLEYSVKFIMSKIDLASFESWYHNYINSGADKFYLKIDSAVVSAEFSSLLDSELAEYTLVSFAGGYSIQPYTDDLFSVSGSLVTQQPNIIAEALTTIVSNFENSLDFENFTESLHDFVNNTLPNTAW